MKRWKNIMSNLWRNQDSGRYYARVDVRRDGKTVAQWKSLKTASRAKAEIKLPLVVAELKAKAGAALNEDLLLSQCAALYLARLKERGYSRSRRKAVRFHKPRSLDYRQEIDAFIRRNWGGFATLKASQVTPAMCQAFADRIRGMISAGRFNGTIQSLRGMLKLAVESGCLRANPAEGIEAMEVKPGDKFIPSREQFTEILRRLDFVAKRKFARLSVRGMAFTGLRPNEARHLKKEDVNLKAGTLIARETKNSKPRTIILINQALEFFEAEGVDKVLAAFKKNPKKALGTICREMNLPNLTPYTMRHLHLTALVESGIDIGVAADIAGHGDRGVTLLRHYRHSRPEHLRKELARVII